MNFQTVGGGQNNGKQGHGTRDPRGGSGRKTCRYDRKEHVEKLFSGRGKKNLTFGGHGWSFESVGRRTGKGLTV